MIDAVRGHVIVIDDEESVRKSIVLLLKSAGFFADSFASVTEFFAVQPDSRPGCILLDIFMKDESGLEWLERLTDKFACLPVVYMTGHGDIPMSVKALKNGAIDFLQKPFDDFILIEAIEEAIKKSEKMILKEQYRSRIRILADSLTPREHEIFAQVVTGKLNKQIAFDLKISEHTVKLHRGKITEKLGIKSVAEMVVMAEQLNPRMTP